MTTIQRPRRFAAAILTLVPLCSACRADVRASSTIVTTMDTIGGVVHVRNAGAPRAGSLTERVRLGSAGLETTDSNQVFGRIAGVVADANGRIYIADANAHQIRVFDEGGAFLHRFGSEGAGPGEVRALQSIGIMGDTLAVLDWGNARLGLFSTDGEWLDHRQYMALSGSGIRLHMTGSHELYMPFVGAVGEQRGLLFVRQTPGGARDTLSASLHVGAPAATTMRERASALAVLCRHSAGRGISLYSADLAPSAIVVPAPDALRAAASGAEYSIAFVDAAGDTVRVIERDLASGPLNDEEWADEQRRFQEFLDQFDDESCEPRTLPRPPVRRMLLSIFFDDAGRTWVERETATGRVFDVFDGAGRLLAELEAPQRLDRVPPYVRDGRLYLVVTDSLDVEYVNAFDVNGVTELPR